MTCFFLPHTEFSQAQRRGCRFAIFHQRYIKLIKGMGWKEGPLLLRMHARCHSNLIEALKTKSEPEGSLSITGLTADDKWRANLWLKGQTVGFGKVSTCKPWEDLGAQIYECVWTNHLKCRKREASGPVQLLKREAAVCFHANHYGYER